MATLVDGSSIQLLTILFEVQTGKVSVQLRHTHPDYGTNDKYASYSLTNAEELDENGDVVSAANAASDFIALWHDDPDHPETWAIQQINDDAGKSQETADFTAETEANGTAYLPRSTR